MKKTFWSVIYVEYVPVYFAFFGMQETFIIISSFHGCIRIFYTITTSFAVDCPKYFYPYLRKILVPSRNNFTRFLECRAKNTRETPYQGRSAVESREINTILNYSFTSHTIIVGYPLHHSLLPCIGRIIINYFATIQEPSCSQTYELG